MNGQPAFAPVSAVFAPALLFASAAFADDKPTLPGPTATGFLLPNGWHLTPAGQHIAISDLPLNIHPLKDNKHALVTTNGGGTWTDISNGLDGSGIQQIIPNPTPGSHDAFAVTNGGTDVASYDARLVQDPTGLPGALVAQQSITIHNTNLKIQDLAVRINLIYPDQSKPLPSGPRWARPPARHVWR